MNSLKDKRTLLIELAEEYNLNNSGLTIDTSLSYDDILFSLWMRQVDVGSLGFGQPYDEILSRWTPMDDENGNPILDLNYSMAYMCYKNKDKANDFLYYQLLANEKNEKFKKTFYETVKGVGMQDKFTGMFQYDFALCKKMLINREFSDLEVVCTMLEYESNWAGGRSIGIFDFLEYVGYKS